MGEHFVGLYIKLVGSRGTCVNTYGGQYFLEVCNVHLCSSTLLSEAGIQTNDEKCGEVLKSFTQYYQ